MRRSLLAPIPGQELVDAPGGMIRQPRQDVSEPGLWVDVVELGSCDQRVDGGCPPATFIGACEGPVAASDRDSAQLALGSIIRHAQPPIIEEAGERIPTL